jgi:hypothetical protein
MRGVPTHSVLDEPHRWRLRPGHTSDALEAQLEPRVRRLWQTLRFVRVPNARLEPDGAAGGIKLIFDACCIGRWTASADGFVYTPEGSDRPAMLAESALDAVECTLELLVVAGTRG